MPTLSTRPTYAVPKRQTSVIFALSDGASNFVRVWCSVAPRDSELDARIAKKKGAGTATRVLVYEGNAGVSDPWRHVFDKGGAYTLIAQEYTKGNAWGGGYEGDPRGVPSETKRGGEVTLALYIAQRMTMSLGIGDDTAKLVIYVHNQTVIQTIQGPHDETTPSIIEPSSDRARTAALADSLMGPSGEVRDLVGENVSALASNANYQFGLKGVLEDFATRWNLHLANGGGGGTYHDNVDTFNVIGEAIVPPFPVEMSPEQAAKACSDILRLVRRHMLNDNGGGPGSGNFHGDPDPQNLPIVDGARDLDDAFVAGGDLRRAYEAHRLMAGNVHSPTDTVNVLAVFGGVNSMLLIAIHQKFMAELAKSVPTAPPGQSFGAAYLAQQSGMVEG